MSFLNDLRDEIHAIECAVERVDVTGVRTTVQTVVEKQEETDKKMDNVITDVSTMKEKLDRLEHTLSAVFRYLEVTTPNFKRSDADIHRAVKLWIDDRAAALVEYGHISKWDTSAVTNMRELFKDCQLFNDDISGWNVSQVTNMGYMFYGAAAFNQAIGQWNVSQVTTMAGMFYGAAAFNQDIGQWNVSKVTW